MQSAFVQVAARAACPRTGRRRHVRMLARIDRDGRIPARSPCRCRRDDKRKLLMGAVDYFTTSTSFTSPQLALIHLPCKLLSKLMLRPPRLTVADTVPVTLTVLSAWK
jgi:hypothetical protein